MDEVIVVEYRACMVVNVADIVKKHGLTSESDPDTFAGIAQDYLATESCDPDAADDSECIDDVVRGMCDYLPDRAAHASRPRSHAVGSISVAVGLMWLRSGS